MGKYGGEMSFHVQKSFNNARLIGNIFDPQKIFGRWKYIGTKKVYNDFCKVFQRNFHPFRDVFQKKNIWYFSFRYTFKLRFMQQKTY